MATVDTVLAQIDGILAELRRNVNVAGMKKANLVIEARRRIIEQLVNMQAALGTDEKFMSKPELAREFKERLTSLRQTMSQLQAKWRAVNIEEDFETYARESQPVAEACVAFVGWAKAARARH